MSDIITGYKRLIPTRTGWRSPSFECVWTDRAMSDVEPTEHNASGIYGVFNKHECTGYFGVLVQIQAQPTIILGEKGFRCQEAQIINYDDEEREAFLFFGESTTNAKIELGIRCALQVYNNQDFVRWADEWIKGTNRTTEAAWAARAAAAAGAAAGVAGAAARAAARAWAVEAGAARAAAAAELAVEEGAVTISNESHPLTIAVRQYKEAHP